MKRIIHPILLLLLTACQAQVKEPLPVGELKRTIAADYPKIDAMIVERGGTVLIEEYFNGFRKDSLHDMRSSFKSVTSLLAGIAIDRNLFSPDDKLSRFFPELKDEGKRNISVRNLLEMRSGLNCEEFYDKGPECEDAMSETDDWVAFCLGVDLVRKPGTKWSYNSNEPMLVGEIITRASGMSVMDFAKVNLFSPLGIETYRWTTSPKGQGLTAGSFFLRPSDMLKIIRLVGDSGWHNGKQLVSKDWIKKSTDCRIDIDFSFTQVSRIPEAKYGSARYGFFWYQEGLHYGDINTEVIFASGNGGQYMMLLPKYNATVVFTGSSYGNWRSKLPFEVLLKYIIPVLQKSTSGAG